MIKRGTGDTAGRTFEGMVKKAVKLARGEEAIVVDRHPPSEFKDWDHQVRGIKVTVEEIAPINKSRSS